MGGNSEGIGNITTCAEFNFHADPEAAFVVLQRCNSSIQLVTWETCRYGNYVDWVNNNIICHNYQFLVRVSQSDFPGSLYYTQTCQKLMAHFLFPAFYKNVWIEILFLSNQFLLSFTITVF